jgi:Uma2 family endonuclease
MSIATKPMTVKEFLALPEDGIDRELIRGELRIKGMTKRNRLHTQATARISQRLLDWADAQPTSPGCAFSGEAGCMLPNDEQTVVGIDVAFFSQVTLDQQTDGTTMIAGAPLLAVEILSPSDKQEEIIEKIDLYLGAGTALVWIVEPRFRTVTVYRPDAEPQLFNERQQLTAEPHLPGFSVPVARLFS